MGSAISRYRTFSNPTNHFADCCFWFVAQQVVELYFIVLFKCVVRLRFSKVGLSICKRNEQNTFQRKYFRGVLERRIRGTFTNRISTYSLRHNRLLLHNLNNSLVDLLSKRKKAKIGVKSLPVSNNSIDVKAKQRLSHHVVC